MAYYQRLKDLREDKDLTQSQVAEVLNTTYQYYSKYESGIRPITFERVIELAKFYNVSLDYIAGLTNDKRGIGYTEENKEKGKNKGKYNITQSNSGGNNVLKIKD